MAQLLQLVIGGSTEPWAHIGCEVVGDRVRFSDVDIVCAGGPPGIHAWVFGGDRSRDFSLDGIGTQLTSSHGVEEQPVRVSAIGTTQVLGIDHVVVNTDDLERTCAAIERELSASLRRVREAGKGMRQGFHRLDNTIIEVVSAPGMNVDGAALWGLVPVVADLESLARHLGPDVISVPKPAVQDGRLIATVRPAVGLGIALAFMSPHTNGTPAN